MILLLDLGNTRLKWCVVDHARVSVSLSASTSLPVSSVVINPRDIQGQLRRAIGELEGIRQIVFASVGHPILSDAVHDWCESHWGLAVQRLRTTAQACGVMNGYRDYSQMGVDRWLAILAARVIEPGKMVCVIDAGSAITVDLLDPQGRHQGGVILSGTRDVSELFSAHQSVIPETPFGRSTDECLTLGRELEESAEPLPWLMGRVEAISSIKPKFLVTGGNAEPVGNAWGLDARSVPSLVFMGMLAIIQSKPAS